MQCKMADGTSGTSTFPATTRGQQRNHYTTVKMAPCRVCGGVSTGYHFGVVSCEACKAFFRRAISKESYGRHGCKKGSDCASKGKITTCCSCRLKRCLEAGMTREGARRGRYSIELRTKSILDARRVEKESLASERNKNNVNGDHNVERDSPPAKPKKETILDPQTDKREHLSSKMNGKIFIGTHTAERENRLSNPIKDTILGAHEDGREILANINSRQSSLSATLQTSPNNNSNSQSDEHTTNHSSMLFPKPFPWKQKSEFFKFTSDSSESHDVESRDAIIPEPTNEDCSLMKAICEGYSFCQSPDCAYIDLEDVRECTPPQSSPELGPASNISSDVLHNINYVSESITGNSDAPVKNGEFKTNIPKYSCLEEKHSMDTLIQTLVNLQGTVYPHHKVTADILQKQKVIEDQHQQREEAFLCMFGSNEYTSTDEFLSVLAEVNIELDDRLFRFREKARATESSIIQYIHHSKFIPGFNGLNSQDVSSLLKASYSEFWLFSNFATLNKDTGVSGGTDVVINGHKKVIKTFFPKAFVDDMFAFAESLQKLELSLEEVSIIRMIVLTFIDRCPLKEPDKVDRLNQLYLHCLRYHLSKSVPNSTSRFCKIFDRLIAVRSLMHRNKAVNEAFLKEWCFLMTDFPLWKEMMVSQISRL